MTVPLRPQYLVVMGEHYMNDHIKPVEKSIEANVEVAEITQTILNYMVGDMESRAQALHPSLVKRTFAPHPRTKAQVLRVLTRSQLIEGARHTPKGASRQKNKDWNINITVLDIHENIATAKAINPFCIDYIHLAKIGA